MTQRALAFDRSVRTIDSDGRLHVQVANISRACVNPYGGHEIPGAAALGLDPSRVYQMFRPPEELARAAPTFRNSPLLSEHVMATADDHRPDSVVGAVGTDVRFLAPYLQASLVVWASDAITAIEDGSQRELSAAYRYVPDMTPGIYQGERYDGRMTQIEGSHVALVAEGRAGAQVVVGDSKLEGGYSVDDDMKTELLEFLATVLSDEDMARVKDIVGDDMAADDDDLKRSPIRGAARAGAVASMDSRRIVAAVQALRRAEAEVLPYAGAIVGMDSAAGVYREALRRAGHNVAGLHPSAARSMWQALRGGGKRTPVMDARASADFAKRFPGAVSLKNR
jgi:hypothetical protein